MRKLSLNRNGILVPRAPMANQRPMPPNLKQDDRIFLDALDVLLEKHADRLVEKLAEKLGQISIALPQQESRIVRHSEASEDLSKPSQIKIDTSTFVVEQRIDNVEKGFEEIAAKQTTEDKEAAASINKLRNLKKGKS